MQAEQTFALILRVYPFSETSCVLPMYTQGFGKIAVLAKGAWRPRSPFEGALDLLSLCRVVFLPKAGDALGILTEAKLVKRFRPARRELLRYYGGYYVSELLDRLTEKDQVQPEIFDLAATTLADLSDPRCEPRAIILRWELQMLRLLGHLPSWDRCSQCGRELPRSVVLPLPPLAGGVLCSTCASGQRPLIQLPVTARQEFVRLSVSDWQTTDVTQISETGRAAMRGAMERYFATLLERRFNVTPFLQELGH